MAKKTKSQKIIATLRRQIKSRERFGASPQEEIKTISENVNLVSEPKSKDPDIQDISFLKYLKRDLTKTLILSILIFAIEIFFYWKL